MKTIVIILATVLLLALFNSYKSPEPMRYFFVGYAANDGSYGGVTIKMTDGKFLTYDSTVKMIKKYQNITEKIAVTSVYEFRSVEEYNRFSIGLNKIKP